MDGRQDKVVAWQTESAVSSTMQHLQMGLKAHDVVGGMGSAESVLIQVMSACSNFSAFHTKHAALAQQLHAAASRLLVQQRLAARQAALGAQPRMQRAECLSFVENILHFSKCWQASCKLGHALPF